MPFWGPGILFKYERKRVVIQRFNQSLFDHLELKFTGTYSINQ